MFNWYLEQILLYKHNLNFYYMINVIALGSTFWGSNRGHVCYIDIFVPTTMNQTKLFKWVEIWVDCKKTWTVEQYSVHIMMFLSYKTV